jgi:hypothetical protein
VPHGVHVQRLKGTVPNGDLLLLLLLLLKVSVLQTPISHRLSDRVLLS